MHFLMAKKKKSSCIHFFFAQQISVPNVRDEQTPPPICYATRIQNPNRMLWLDLSDKDYNKYGH